MYTEIKQCRICGNTNLISVVNLGNQYLTGVFPKSITQQITSGPLELVKCHEDRDGNTCGLVQLKHSYDHNEMYGENYGYRSGINKSMVNHLHDKVKKIQAFTQLTREDLIIDIGSNDSTLLQAYRQDGLLLVGIDPTGEKFKKYYPEHVHLIPDFFSAESVRKNFGNRKAKVVTSIAMFYDLESPVDFARQINDILADDGIWVFEQSYMPTMLEMNAYDTICHEHLEYYCLKQIKWITDKAGLKIIDIEFNKINGGSFSVIAAKPNSPFNENAELIEKVLLEESQRGLHTLIPYEEFKQRVLNHRAELHEFIKKTKDENKKIFGYGASTKGNVVLQFCDISEKDIHCIAEVNSDKFGCYTPGTNIPIVSEEEAKKMKPDYFMVLPWHFRDNIMEREKNYLDSGGKLLFPLPFLEVV
ncbi:MAG: class I SAM-dependent methyltransferase [Proteobacteria bacterium]|nr:class I SAM-dependent methyltransferase [Pseudomonadota bacterium]